MAIAPQKAAGDPPTLTVADVMAQTGLAKTTLVEMADAGLVRCVRHPTAGGKCERRFRQSDVDAYLASVTTGTQAPAVVPAADYAPLAAALARFADAARDLSAELAALSPPNGRK